MRQSHEKFTFVSFSLLKMCHLSDQLFLVDSEGGFRVVVGYQPLVAEDELDPAPVQTKILDGRDEEIGQRSTCC